MSDAKITRLQIKKIDISFSSGTYSDENNAGDDFVGDNIEFEDNLIHDLDEIILANQSINVSVFIYHKNHVYNESIGTCYITLDIRATTITDYVSDERIQLTLYTDRIRQL